MPVDALVSTSIATDKRLLGLAIEDRDVLLDAVVDRP